MLQLKYNCRVCVCTFKFGIFLNFENVMFIFKPISLTEAHLRTPVELAGPFTWGCAAHVV